MKVRLFLISLPKNLGCQEPQQHDHMQTSGNQGHQRHLVAGTTPGDVLFDRDANLATEHSAGTYHRKPLLSSSVRATRSAVSASSRFRRAC